MFSVLILTLNEERNLPACLASIRGCDDILVLDSGSTDRTVPIARAAGARVATRRFTTFADQRNHGLDLPGWKNDWIFHLDADEQFTPELYAECSALTAQNPADYDGFYAAPKMLYHGRWIPHCTDYPAWQARLGQLRRFRFIQVGHGQREAPGLRLGRLHAPYLHNLSAQTDAEMEAKHRRYARDEAAAYHARATHPVPLLNRLLSPDPLERRRALKHLSQRLPARAPLRFLYQYFLRRGLLDGLPGLSYCLFLARYESWITAEIRRQRPSK